MIEVSEVLTGVPGRFESALQQAVFETLTRLSIQFNRVDNEPAITMEDCEAINQRLEAKTVKTLFLTNRQQTLFYLFVTTGHKPFVTKDFGKALGIPRVSFASAEKLAQYAHTPVGAATPLSVILDTEQRYLLVLDKDILEEEYLCCPDGTTTGYIKLRVADVLRVIEESGHHPRVIEV